ncbi:MAG: hypothetical protein WA800_09055 [Terriglobales bacterium]
MMLILIALAAAAPAPAQDISKPPDQGGQDTQKPETPGGALAESVKKPVEVFNLLDEKSIVFPDIAASTQPLTPSEKFEMFVDNSISVHTIMWSALGSAVGQADDSPTGFGQGWDAYANRFGSSMARGASSEFFGTFILASAMHYDPRFFPERDPSLGHAIAYSVSRVFISRADDGRRVVNVPGLVGPLLGEALANVYWPDRNRTVGDTFFRYGLDLATRAGGNMLREYWPVVYRKLSHTTAALGLSTETSVAGQ